MPEAYTENIFEKELLKESIFLDRNLLSPHFTPKELPFREKQINEISSILAPLVHKKKPNNLFAYGKPGTGKTTVTTKVLNQLLEFSVSKNLGIFGSYVNCRTHNKKYRVMLKMAKDFYPEENFLGFSGAFIYEKVLDFARKGKDLVIVLDEIDKVKDVDDLVYSLSRANDEIKSGSITIIGISNNVMFKDKLDPRTKSSLCEHEMVFPPYNAQELCEILKQRAEKAFKPGVVEESAVNLAAAIAAHESGDARTAVMLLLRAGEVAERKNSNKVTDEEVKKAKNKVEEEIILNMISTLPQQEQLVLLAIAGLSLQNKGIKKITGKIEEGVLFSGEIYEEYTRISRAYKEETVSARWYREYISELEMYGLILTTSSGKGIRGQTRLIKLGFDAKKIKDAIEKEIIA
ncbi:MAG: AAA family ATPase [archaeon]|nr:AAA family ATPase [archaeon]